MQQQRRRQKIVDSALELLKAAFLAVLHSYQIALVRLLPHTGVDKI